MPFCKNRTANSFEYDFVFFIVNQDGIISKKLHLAKYLFSKIKSEGIRDRTIHLTLRYIYLFIKIQPHEIN